MTTRRLLCACCCAVLLTNAAVAREHQGPNLLAGSSFQRGWQVRPAARFDRRLTHGNRAALRLDGPAQGYAVQDVMLAADTRYLLTAWVRTSNVKGEGVWLQYAQTHPSPEALAESTALSGSTDWVEVKAGFVTPPYYHRGTVLVRWNLLRGDTAWLDDISLRPYSGDRPVAPAPAWLPAGGEFEEHQQVSLQTRIPGAVLRYTLDGSEPDQWSMIYQRPLTLWGSATLKARAFQASYDGGLVAQARFKARPLPRPGVPPWPVDWNLGVADWWRRHALNTASPVAIISPALRVDVAEVRAKHPETTTAGIEEALRQLPIEGGTLWFPRQGSPYVMSGPLREGRDFEPLQAALLILGRSHLHFVSDGAVIKCRYRALGFASMDFADHKRLERPMHDLYFKNLVFDGTEQANGALSFSHARDVLLEGCSFMHLAAGADAVRAESGCGNLWCRDCGFEGAGWGVGWSGVQGGGLLNCRFGGTLAGGARLTAQPQLAPWSAAEPLSQYVVVNGCRFEGGAASRHWMPARITGAHCLFSNNTVHGPFAAMIALGAVEPRPTNEMHYHLNDIAITGNRCDGADALLQVRAERQSPAADYEVRDNTATGLSSLLELDPGGGTITGVAVNSNQLGGPSLPEVRLNRGGCSGIVVERNELTGRPRDLLNAPLNERDNPGVIFRDNRINPQPVTKPARKQRLRH